MKISEIFHSIQGEGRLAGTPSVFIRTGVCNLRCSWCDTPYTSWDPEFRELSVTDILKKAKQLSTVNSRATHHAVITGGEPFLETAELAGLCHELCLEGFHITIETNATIFAQVNAHLISLSPKLSNSTPAGKLGKSHERHRINLDAVRAFIDTYKPPDRDVQVKLVIDSEADLAEVAELERVAAIPKRKIMLMPQARERDELAAKSRWLVELCCRTGYSFSPRLHIELFGNRRGV
jgi:7-carboxy-7-deazaguanine synthase